MFRGTDVETQKGTLQLDRHVVCAGVQRALNGWCILEVIMHTHDRRHLLELMNMPRKETMLYFLGLLLMHKDPGNTAAMSQLSWLHTGLSGAGSSDPKDSPMTKGREGEGLWGETMRLFVMAGTSSSFPAHEPLIRSETRAASFRLNIARKQSFWL